MKKIIRASDEAKSYRKLIKSSTIEDEDEEDLEACDSVMGEDGADQYVEDDIMGAEGGGSKEEAFDEGLSDLKSDFDYAMDGLDKMARDGNTDEALSLVLEFSSGVAGIISKIVDGISGEVTEE